MHTASGLHVRLLDAEEFDLAACSSTAGKRRRPDVAWFLFRREPVLARILSELRDGSWRPGPFALLRVHDPKPRLIARASVEDRIVHAALVRQMERPILRGASDADFACRPGFGTHAARRRLLRLVRAFEHAVHLDVRAYFPSVRADLLRRLLAARIRDARFLAVLDQVIERGRGLYDTPAARAFVRMDAEWPPRGEGLPIGASTSQLWAAHLYLQALDHHVQRVLHVRGYLRYVDDLFLFGDRRGALRAQAAGVAEWLWTERELKLKAPEPRVQSCREPLDGLGARITRDGIAPRPRALRALRAAAARQVYRLAGERLPDFARSVASRVGGILVPG